MTSKIRKAPELEILPNGEVMPPVKVSPVIVTRQDKAVWIACCQRLKIDPRNPRLRYLTIGGHGITAVTKQGGEHRGEWQTGVGLMP